MGSYPDADLFYGFVIDAEHPLVYEMTDKIEIGGELEWWHHHPTVSSREYNFHANSIGDAIYTYGFSPLGFSVNTIGSTSKVDIPSVPDDAYMQVVALAKKIGYKVKDEEIGWWLFASYH